MTRPADEARQRARGIRDEALSRLARQDRDSIDHLRSELAEMKAMLHRQSEQLAALTALLSGRGVPAVEDAPPASTPRPLSGAKRAALERIRDLRGQDLSFARICEIFQAENVPTLSGEGRWSKGTLWNLWRNHSRQLDPDRGE
jgi:uncharacterized coiled-coil protein SlyX